MQVKKFEAPTIQEALDTIKREMGPEAIILQTKQNKKGFGLMSQGSVEVTVAVSDRSLQKKRYTETKLPEKKRQELGKLPASQQAQIYDRYTKAKTPAKSQPKAEERYPAIPAVATRAYHPVSEPVKASYQEPAAPQVALQAQAFESKITQRRYIDIEDSLDESKISPPITAERKVPVGTGEMSMAEELKHLKRMIEEMKLSQADTLPASGAQALGRADQAWSSQALQDAFEQLVLNGMDRRYAYSLIRKVSFELDKDGLNDPDQVLDHLAGEIMNTTEVSSILSGVRPNENGKEPHVITLVGPTGVGKTTTVAKIASEAFLKKNLKVGLVNLDTYKVAAFDQLATYAKILNIPFRSVTSREDLKTALTDFQALDLILIDTTGRSQRDGESLREMDQLLQVIPKKEVHLLLSVTTRDSELYDMAHRFSVFRPSGLMLSKLDEATLFGALYNVSQKMKLPLVCFTTGQRVPEDFEDATPERVAALIMDL